MAAIVCTTGVGAARDAKKREVPPPSWPGTELPLPLAVRTPHDLAFKALAERHYLVFNLLAGGKAAFDAGDFASAALKWEALLQLPRLDLWDSLAVKAEGLFNREVEGAPNVPNDVFTSSLVFSW